MPKRRLRFDPRLVHVQFAVESVAPGQVLFRVRPVSPLNYYSVSVQYAFNYRPGLVVQSVPQRPQQHGTQYHLTTRMKNYQKYNCIFSSRNLAKGRIQYNNDVRRTLSELGASCIDRPCKESQGSKQSVSTSPPPPKGSVCQKLSMVPIKYTKILPKANFRNKNQSL